MTKGVGPAPSNRCHGLKIFTYFFHDNKDHISGRKPLQYQLIISILAGVKHPSPIPTPKIARYENRDRCFQSLKTSLTQRVNNLNGLPHSLLSYGHLIPGERACTGRTCLIKKFFQGPSKDRYIPWAVPEDSGYWLNGVLRGWSANG